MTAVMELVEASPRLVARHDRAGWLALFAPDAVIADPVGPPPARREPGRPDALGVFYDTFIRTTDVRFEVLRDHVAPRAVLRDAVLHNVLAGGGRVSVPTLILYEAREVDGALRLAGLSSFWDLRKPGRELRGQGWRGLRSLIGAGWTMTRQLGIGGLWRYFRAPAQGMGDARAERVSQALAEAMTGRDENAFRALGGGSPPLIESPFGVPSSAAALVGRPTQATGGLWGGWSLACRLEIAGEPGAAVVDLVPGTDDLRRVRLFMPTTRGTSG